MRGDLRPAAALERCPQRRERLCPDLRRPRVQGAGVLVDEARVAVRFENEFGAAEWIAGRVTGAGRCDGGAACGDPGVGSSISWVIGIGNFTRGE